MARSRKNGRFTKNTRRRRRTKSFSVGKAAETALIANAAITGLFATNLPTFLTGRDIGGGFGANDTNNSWELTLPELANAMLGGTGGVNAKFKFNEEGGVMGAIKRNISTNGMSALTQVVAIPIAFKIGRKLLAKPLINPTNRMLKQVGLKEVKL